jgi:hypothetical protein
MNFEPYFSGNNYKFAKVLKLYSLNQIPFFFLILFIVKMDLNLFNLIISQNREI